MTNGLSPASLAARCAAIMGALAACLSSPPPPDFCPFGNGVAAR